MPKNKLVECPTDDKTLKKICREFSRGIIGKRGSAMQCAVVSYALHGYLLWSLNIRTKICEGDVGKCNHVWLEHPDGFVIDCTTDQFNDDKRKHPQVYIGNPLDIHSSFYSKKSSIKENRHAEK